MNEELEKEAEEYVSKYQGWGWTPHEGSAVYNAMLNSYIDSAEPREKEIKSLGERCLQLQKDKGELIDKVNDLEEKLANADYQLEGRDLEIKELKAQIEKMSETLLDLLWFEGNLDPYMYECNEAQKGELLKPFTNAREYLKDYICKKCKGEGIVRVGYNGWDKNPCPACKGKGYIFRR